MTLGCVNGKILHVDLTSGKTWQETPPESFYRTYGGGSAMGLYYILKEMPAGVDALDPGNILTFFVGVPTGLPISGQSRLAINARSPLGGAIGDSQGGGFFPAMMKRCGFDGIVVRGRSPRPVYLWLYDGKAEVREAAHLWGKITGEVEDAIRSELGNDKIEVAQIGPAGEKLVRFASVMNMCNRANGRTGMGAVMGSKNLKAVAVFGNAKMNSADPKTMSQLFRLGTENMKTNPAMAGMHIHGTTGDVSGMNAAGGLPTHNFNEGQFEYFEDISGERMTDTILVERDTCFSCSVRCKRVVKTEFKGEAVLPRYGGVEYETMATMGSYCGVRDMDAIALANQICNQYGIDTISCGATIAFAMECFEKGILTLKDTGGMDLSYGSGETLVNLTRSIGLRQGFGDVLADGSERAAAKLGGKAADCLITSKGTEAPAHMPQHKRMMGLLYAVNPFGADHMSAEHDPFIEEGADDLGRARMAELGLTELLPPGSVSDKKAQMTWTTQRLFSANDSLCLCSFVWGVGWTLYGPNQAVEMLRAATGWDITLDELLALGERRMNMMRAFNAREGFTRKEDALGNKFFRPLEGSGPNAGVKFEPAEFESLKDAYYRNAGWDVATGNPGPQKLASLGLEWIR